MLGVGQHGQHHRDEVSSARGHLGPHSHPAAWEPPALCLVRKRGAGSIAHLSLCPGDVTWALVNTDTPEAPPRGEELGALRPLRGVQSATVALQTRRTGSEGAVAVESLENHQHVGSGV